MSIVVAYADTPPAKAAFGAAVKEALLRKEDIVLVPAVRDLHLTESGLKEFVGSDAESLAAAGVSVSFTDPDLHDPADAVIQAAQQADASLICLGLRHRSPVGKLLLGSTAQRILLDATCPVLAVKAD